MSNEIIHLRNEFTYLTESLKYNGYPDNLIDSGMEHFFDKLYVYKKLPALHFFGKLSFDVRKQPQTCIRNCLAWTLKIPFQPKIPAASLFRFKGHISKHLS